MAIPEDDAQRRRRWPTQGVVMAPVTAGEAVGKPLQEPAHITPTFPRGIKDSDLQYADRGVQRETALWWFLLNLEPYDLSKRGPYFGFSGAIGGAPIGALPIGGGPNIAGFDQGTFAPTPVVSLVILREEFAGVLPDDVIEQIGRSLAGDWMWKSPAVQTLKRPPMTASEALAALVPILDALAAELRNMEVSPVHGGIGHNRPEDAFPLTEESRKRVFEKIEEAKQVALAGGKEASAKIAQLWEKIAGPLGALSKWTLKQMDAFASNFAIEAGKSTGKWAGPMIGTAFIGTCVSIASRLHEGSAVVEALQHLSPH